MNTIDQIHVRLNQDGANTGEILEIFDELDPVNLEFMMSRWQGSEVKTNHPFSGLLELTNWYGKEFISNDHVHPLLFLDKDNNIFKVTPNPMAMQLALRFPILKIKILKPLFRFLTLLSKTETSRARVRGERKKARSVMNRLLSPEVLPIS